jgi:hypothetical protein
MGKGWAEMCTKILVGKLEGRRPFGRSANNWGDIKMDLK